MQLEHDEMRHLERDSHASSHFPSAVMPVQTRLYGANDPSCFGGEATAPRVHVLQTAPRAHVGRKDGENDVCSIDEEAYGRGMRSRHKQRRIIQQDFETSTAASSKRCLEEAARPNSENDASGAPLLRCEYRLCPSSSALRGATQHAKFHRILENTNEAGWNWTPVIGHIICHACYWYFRKNGTLKRATGLRVGSPPKTGQRPCNAALSCRGACTTGSDQLQSLESGGSGDVDEEEQTNSECDIESYVPTRCSPVMEKGGIMATPVRNRIDGTALAHSSPYPSPDGFMLRNSSAMNYRAGRQSAAARGLWGTAGAYGGKSMRQEDWFADSGSGSDSDSDSDGEQRSVCEDDDNDEIMHNTNQGVREMCMSAKFWPHKQPPAHTNFTTEASETQNTNILSREGSTHASRKNTTYECQGPHRISASLREACLTQTANILSDTPRRRSLYASQAREGDTMLQGTAQEQLFAGVERHVAHDESCSHTSAFGSTGMTVSGMLCGSSLQATSDGNATEPLFGSTGMTVSGMLCGSSLPAISDGNATELRNLSRMQGTESEQHVSRDKSQNNTSIRTLPGIGATVGASSATVLQNRAPQRGMRSKREREHEHVRVEPYVHDEGWSHRMMLGHAGGSGILRGSRHAGESATALENVAQEQGIRVGEHIERDESRWHASGTNFAEPDTVISDSHTRENVPQHLIQQQEDAWDDGRAHVYDEGLGHACGLGSSSSSRILRGSQARESVLQHLIQRNVWIDEHMCDET
jgi:hypothetical protein